MYIFFLYYYLRIIIIVLLCKILHQKYYASILTKTKVLPN